MMKPESEAELADMVKAASEPLRILGGGTRGMGIAAGAPVTTLGLTGVTLYEPGALTLVVRAGTPVAEVETVLAAEGQRLAFEPMDHRAVMRTDGEPTVGGLVAGNVSGPRRVQVGACRDHLLGVRFVDGAGRVVKNGGRVMKNVTGYDLVKLMAGSWGTLGVLTELSFKVLAIPEAQVTLTCEGLEPEAAVEAMSAALGSPFDVTGAAHVSGRTQVRVEGMGASVGYRCDRLKALLPGFEAVDGAASAALWETVRDVTPLAGRDGDIWRVSVKPSDGPKIAVALGARVLEAIYDWGGGLVWLLTESGVDVRRVLAGLRGHATCLRGAAPVFPPEPPELARLSTGLRAQFDPRGILNAGVMG